MGIVNPSLAIARNKASADVAEQQGCTKQSCVLGINKTFFSGAAKTAVMLPESSVESNPTLAAAQGTAKVDQHVAEGTGDQG
eukprot:123267-Amphidinium_carterae.1